MVEAASKCLSLQAPVLLVASDTPYPEPLHAARPLADSFGLALVLTPQASARSLGALDIGLVGAEAAQPLTVCRETSLEFLRAHIPAAHALPLLQAIARGTGPQTLRIDYLPELQLQVDVCPAAA